MKTEIHPANFISQAEVMGYLGFSDEQIEFLLDHEVPLSTALYSHEEYATHVMGQGFDISIGCTRLRKVDDNGYTDIDEFDNGLYMLNFEEHLKF